MRFSTLFAAAAAAISVEATYSGFNYGSSFTNGAAKQEADFKAEFSRAQELAGTNGEFASARLYTMIQAGTQNTPISAIQAAIDTKTTLLLGLWASAGQANIDNELAALDAAIKQYGESFTSLISGISVGSEDLYRITPTGIENKSGVGAGPDVLVQYIKEVRNVIKNTAASKAPVGHVDTWTAWVNGSNTAVIDNCDFLGVDAYPYFQTVNSNGIDNGAKLFFDAYDATVGVAQGKDVWITETGWPVSGPKSGDAVASVENAETFWKEVACKTLGSKNVYWFTLQDAAPDTPSPSFGIVGSDLSSAPMYDLTCGDKTTSSSMSSSMMSSTMESSSMATPTGYESSSMMMSSTMESSSMATPTGYESSMMSSEMPTGYESSSMMSSMMPTSMMMSSAEPTACPGTTTTTITITNCPGGCPSESATAMPTPSSMVTMVSSEMSSATVITDYSTPESQSSTMMSQSSASTPESMSSGTATPTATGSSCPTNLNGAYQTPHLIVPVDSSKPSEAAGTQYNGTVSSTVSTIFNFDIPQSYAGQTCSLVFLFPEKKDLETTDYTWNGQGGLSVEKCDAPATEATTYANKPASAGAAGTVAALEAGNGYVVSTGPCEAGARIGYEFMSSGGSDLEWFNDWNPSPLGVFITTC